MLAAYAQSGDLVEAVTGLERGRALLLSEILELGTADLTDLERAGHDTLADATQRLCLLE